MRAMMLDVVESRPQDFLRDAERTRQFLFQIAHSGGIAESILDLLKTSTCRCIQDLLVKVGRRIARDSNVIEFFETDTCRFETVFNRLCGKTSGVLEAIETFLF